jgi:hypothetical protein
MRCNPTTATFEEPQPSLIQNPGVLYAMPAAIDGCACSTEPQLEPGNDARGLDEHHFADYAYFIKLVSHLVLVKKLPLQNDAPR